MTDSQASAALTATPPATAAPPMPRAGGHRRLRWLIAVGVVVVVVPVLASIASATGLVERVMGTPVEEHDLFVVEPTTLNVTLKEDGEIKPVHSIELKCEVQSPNITIEWIVEESSEVEEGELLVKLASEDIRDRVETAQMELERIAGALDEARQALMITRSENASALKKAEIDLEVAELELARYLKGEYEKQRKGIQINIKQTEIDLNQKNEELTKSLKLLEKDFVTEAKIKELRDAIEKAEMTLEKHKLELRILDDYELPKNEKQKRSTVERATEELEREKQRCDSREKQAETKVREQEQALALNTRRFERLKEQLSKCEIHAPCDGIVQYGEAGGRRRWNSNRIAVGERVYGGQTLITLPDTSQMMVSTRIHEADRHKVGEGMKCIVRVPAVPEHTFVGRLAEIAQFADSERSWWNPELKEHATEILLDETDAPLSPGDTAHIEILIEEVPDVLAVPVQCIYARGSRRFVFVRQGGTGEPVEVELGRSSTTMIEIAGGLNRGDRVLMAPSDDLLAKLPMPGTTSPSAPQATDQARAEGDSDADDSADNSG